MPRAAAMTLSAALLIGLALGLTVAVAVRPAAALGGNYDGSWTVRVITERGHCDRTTNYDVRLARGKVVYRSYSSVSLWGSVSPDGAVSVSIRHFDDGARGSGRLSERSGGGGWSGVGKKGPCSGHWVAHRH
ncbi:MAG: hypothetical protein ACRECA_02515 [Pseudolabrys sp.]